MDIKKRIAVLAIALNSVPAHAYLVNGTSGGEAVVYSSISDTTWTADANLLGTIMNGMGYSAAVSAIIGVSPVINDTPNYSDTPPNSGAHTLSTADFSAYNLGVAACNRKRANLQSAQFLNGISCN